MRLLLSVLALAALVFAAPATAAPKKLKPAAWASKHDLKGKWRAKDADRDGLKNLAEFKQGTHPRKADTDRDGLKDGDELASANDPLVADTDGDGIKDGAEHAGVVLAYDGETLTLRQFKGGKVTAIVEDVCDADADDAAYEDDEFIDVEETDEWVEDGFDADASTVDEEEAEVDLEADEDATCDLVDVEEGDVLTSATLSSRGGVLYVTDVEIA